MDLLTELLAVVDKTHVAFLLIQLDQPRGVRVLLGLLHVRVLLGLPHLIYLGEPLISFKLILTRKLDLFLVEPNLTQIIGTALISIELTAGQDPAKLTVGQPPALQNRTIDEIFIVLHPL